MLNSTELKNKIIQKIRNKTSHYEAQDSLRVAINDYLISNLELIGIYSGTIPGVPPLPDPLNGSKVTFKLSGFSSFSTPALISASNSGGISAWISSLNVCLKTGIFKPVGIANGSESIFLTVPVLTTGINISMSVSGNSFEDVMHSLASQLVASILRSPVGIPTIPVTSVNGGVGLVTPEGFYK